MDTTVDIHPDVASILESARARDRGGDEPIAVEARSLPAALSEAERDGRAPVIAEVKPTSPTTEHRREDDPVALAEAMVDGGAAAISVLTEPTAFGGSTAALRRIREAVAVPVLRKDFVLRDSQLDAVAADAVLVVARFVEDLEGLVAAARERGMEPLVEVHDAADLERALAAGADLVGVNNRDLARLRVDLGTVDALAPRVPDGATLIAESGISTRADVRRMRAAGADGLLVGSAIMAGDVRERTRTLAGEGERST